MSSFRTSHGCGLPRTEHHHLAANSSGAKSRAFSRLHPLKIGRTSHPHAIERNRRSTTNVTRTSRRACAHHSDGGRDVLPRDAQGSRSRARPAPPRLAARERSPTVSTLDDESSNPGRGTAIAALRRAASESSSTPRSILVSSSSRANPPRFGRAESPSRGHVSAKRKTRRFMQAQPVSALVDLRRNPREPTGYGASHERSRTPAPG